MHPIPLTHLDAVEFHQSSSNPTLSSQIHKVFSDSNLGDDEEHNEVLPHTLALTVRTVEDSHHQVVDRQDVNPF